MRIVFLNLPGRPDVPHLVTEADQVTYPHVILEAHGRESRAKYLGTIGYTALAVREASPGEVAQWRNEPR